MVGKDNLVNGTFCGANGNVALKTWKILAVKNMFSSISGWYESTGLYMGINQAWAPKNGLVSDFDRIFHSSVALISKMDGSTKKDYEFAGSTGSLFLNPDSDLSIFYFGLF